MLWEAGFALREIGWLPQVVSGRHLAMLNGTFEKTFRCIL